SGSCRQRPAKMDGLQIKQNGHTEVHRPVAGIFLENTKEKITIYQAMKKRMLKAGTALALLEAQAATGGIIDPKNNRVLPVADAVKEGVVGPEMKEKLLTAEKAISGYVDPYTKQTISVFQAMQKDLVPRDYGLRLLEAQIATQGLFDPTQKSNISIESAIQKGYYEKGLLNDQMSELKVFYHPISQENLSYQNLLEKCTVEPVTGLCLLPLNGKSGSLNFNFIDYQSKMALKNEKVKVTCGKYMGMTVSLWELLMSEYFDEQQSLTCFHITYRSST
uniref:PLEC n=1 Tax=Seriola lalandi dorsalis TaxID=1841481 RepID=A0A3B4XVT3_SERLL